MNTFQIYDDLLLEIEILKEQIDCAEKERDQWWIGGRLFNTVPMDNAAGRVDKINERIQNWSEQLQEKTSRADRLRNQLSRYQGLEYKIYYKRFIECKTLKEIACELGYSYQYIKEVSMRIKAKEHTTNILSS